MWFPIQRWRDTERGVGQLEMELVNLMFQTVEAKRAQVCIANNATTKGGFKFEVQQTGPEGR
jgi:hypothetical protein